MRAVPDAVLVIDADGRVVEANAAADALLGDGPTELVGRLADSLLAGVANVTLTPAGSGELIALIRPATFDPGYLDAILESCGDAMYRQDRDGLITGWNPAAASLFGYAAADVLGWRSTRLVAEEHWDEHELILRRVLAGEAHGHVEMSLRRRDGIVVPAVLAFAPIRDGSGRVVGASVIATDVTEHQEALATLAESEARLRAGESLAHLGGWVFDVATGAVQWSQELHGIHGIDPVDFEGTLAAHLALVHPDDRARLQCQLTGAIEGHDSLDAEYRIVRPDGDVRWMHAWAERVVGAGSVVIGLRGVSQDVTERHAHDAAVAR